jgi:hypothetical protein
MQFFVWDYCTMIAAPVQGDVDGMPKGSHAAKRTASRALGGGRRRPALPQADWAVHTVRLSAVAFLTPCTPYPTGIALSILQGYFQVQGAGQTNGGNSSTTAFIWKTTAASISGNVSVINNPMTNGNPNLILIVTQNLVPAANTNGHSVGVEYSPLNSAWTLFNEDGTTMTTGAAYNVLVISP